MNIPIKFYQYGREINVVFDERYCKAKRLYGEANYEEATIYLTNENSEGKPLSRGLIEETFCHELLHMLLDASGWQDVLFKDSEQREHFMNSVSPLLAQAINSITDDGQASY